MKADLGRVNNSGFCLLKVKKALSELIFYGKRRVSKPTIIKCEWQQRPWSAQSNAFANHSLVSIAWQLLFTVFSIWFFITELFTRFLNCKLPDATSFSAVLTKLTSCNQAFMYYLDKRMSRIRNKWCECALMDDIVMYQKQVEKYSLSSLIFFNLFKKAWLNFLFTTAPPDMRTCSWALNALDYYGNLN